jgi:hypothetical protein
VNELDARPDGGPRGEQTPAEGQGDAAGDVQPQIQQRVPQLGRYGGQSPAACGNGPDHGGQRRRGHQTADDSA